LDIKPDDLTFVTKKYSRNYHQDTGLINDKFGKVFAFKYNDSIERLMDKTEEAAGFAWWPINEIINMKDENKKMQFIPTFFDEKNQAVFRKLKEIINTT